LPEEADHSVALVLVNHPALSLDQADAMDGQDAFMLEAIVTRVLRHHVVVTRENLEDARSRAPDLIGRILEPGCVLWTRRRGHLAVVWPRTGQAALVVDKCVMLGPLRIEGKRLLLLEARSRLLFDLNRGSQASRVPLR
jgi:hypothetical protein